MGDAKALILKVPLHLKKKADARIRGVGARKFSEMIDSISGSTFLIMNRHQRENEALINSDSCKNIEPAQAIKFADLLGISIITGNTDKEKYNRLIDDQWWLKQIEKTQLRAQEALAGHLKAIRKHVTRKTHNKQIQRVTRNDRKMEKIYILSEGKIPISLYELSRTSIINRFSRYLNNVSGMTDYGDNLKHDSMMITITCPSRMHPNSDRYDGTTVREAQKYLTDLWAKARRTIQRKGINLYGIRVVEPHKDSCPHWHILVFHEYKKLEYAGRVITRFGLRTDGREKGAKEKRVVCEFIDRNLALPSSYLFKYLLKGMDLPRDATLEEAKLKIADSVTSSTAWAQTHGIRRIQTIGGVSITVWDKLRQLPDEPLEDETLELLRYQSRNGDYADFFTTQGGHNVGKSDHKAQTIREFLKKNRFNEDTKAVSGICHGEAKVIIKKKDVIVTSDMEQVKRFVQKLRAEKIKRGEEAFDIQDIQIDMPMDSLNDDYMEFQGFNDDNIEYGSMDDSYIEYGSMDDDYMEYGSMDDGYIDMGQNDHQENPYIL